MDAETAKVRSRRFGVRNRESEWSVMDLIELLRDMPPTATVVLQGSSMVRLVEVREVVTIKVRRAHLSDSDADWYESDLSVSGDTELFDAVQVVPGL
jgi:hypothetical protein